MTDHPLWPAMSDRLCPDCRVRYLPLRGPCLCVELAKEQQRKEQQNGRSEHFV